ncbi:MAG: methionyl-tRNA formyltransferase [Oscillospiraceae bacterium]|jgi:methionyl-tRNA formyltransferase|nr:methionyl-tRNA formyltransferase [Oscillospiraceae bacterium]
MRILFMGTPQFAVPCLLRLRADGYDVVCAVTQPDQPKGRGYALTPPPVKEAALRLGIPVGQPASLRTPETLALLRGYTPDLIVVTAYGKILPPEVLSLPPLGCVNIHASLLPKYRGAAPIQWAVLQGETETGITSMQMDQGLDTGAMLLQSRIPIPADMTAAQLHDELSALGADVLSETLAALTAATLRPAPQDDALSSYAPLLTKALSPVDWRAGAGEIHNRIRGLFPWPGATASLAGKRLKLMSSRLPGETLPPGPAGELLPASGRLLIRCGNGEALELLALQPDGGKVMAAADYLRGRPVSPGTAFD